MLQDTALDTAFDASWPAAETAFIGGFAVGRGDGGGRRVSAAHAVGPWQEAAIPAVLRQQAEWGQEPLFRAEDDSDLARNLARQGWRDHTPTALLETPVEGLTDLEIPRITTFAIWPPLAIQRDIWRDGGIDDRRQAVMERVEAPKTAILGRIRDRAAASAFVAAAEGVAMLHAVEIVPAQRRNGLARWVVRQAAIWAAGQGCTRLALAVTRDNAPALALYAGLGFSEVAGYRYWTR